ncbi:MAG: DNA polymerase I, partial [Clostridia bacterium]|nr:DNA polymerase I [Clostridia bacterium]
MEQLIAIDGNSLMHRAYYALPSMAAKDGTPTGAVYGFLSMLLKLLERQPTYLLVAFDMHGPTFRHESYAEYKAGRRATPEDLRPQFPLLKEILSAMGIAVCECERFEADDILGTASRMAERAGVQALLVTGDRDALQLITPHTHVLMTKKGISETVEYDETVLRETYGLTPARMPDLKGLMGDSSDNIPGIPGVGEKTALKLLEKYGDLENALAHAGEEKGALKTKLETGGDSARLSYKLGVIDTQAPIQAGLGDWSFRPGSMQGALPLLYKLELRAIAGRVAAARGAEAPREKTAGRLEKRRIADEAGLESLRESLGKAKRLAVVLGETLELAAEGVVQYEISLSGGTLLTPGLEAGPVLALLKPILEDASVEKAVFDGKSMQHALDHYGVRLSGVKWDAMIQDYLLHAIHPASSLKTLCEERGKEPGAAALWELTAQMQAEMEEKELWSLYETVELPLVWVLYDMEKVGFTVDGHMLGHLRVTFAQRMQEIEARIYEQAGEPFNILSPKQLGTILFDKLGLPAQKKTKT